MNIINFKKSATKTNIENIAKPLFNGATKKATKATIKYTLNNKSFFVENHKYLGVISKKNFIAYYKAIPNSHRKGLWLLLNNLTNGIEIYISDVRLDENNISNVEITTKYRGKEVTYKMFYFFGLYKLLSFATNVKYNLDLKELLTIANQK
ncbi:hypothetical protein [Sphingobacterium sp. MYb388]|uniref:hypothetical protein n=1 Tax=Sphingobacterium sp. MYb388 TaxID=2745437 RepID=UPI0030B22807